VIAPSLWAWIGSQNSRVVVADLLDVDAVGVLLGAVADQRAGTGAFEVDATPTSSP